MKHNPGSTKNVRIFSSVIAKVMVIGCSLLLLAARPVPEAELISIATDGQAGNGDSLSDCLDKRDCRQHPACKTTGGGGKNR
jgi:hypothetical protein